MSIDIFFTQLTQQNAQTEGLNAALGVPSTEMGLFDQIIANLGDALKDDSTHKNKENPLNFDNQTLDKDPKLDVAALLSANENVKEEENDKNFILDLQAKITEVLELNKQAFNQDLSLSDVKLVVAKFPENQKAELANFLQGPLTEIEHSELGFLNRFEALLNKIERMVSENSPVLLVTNLTPEQITELKTRINERLFETEEEGGVPPVLDIAATENIGTTEGIAAIEEEVEAKDIAALQTIKTTIEEDNSTDELSNIFIGLINIVAPRSHGYERNQSSYKNQNTKSSPVENPAPLAAPQVNKSPAALNSEIIIAADDAELPEDIKLKPENFKVALDKEAVNTHQNTKTTAAAPQVIHNNLSYLRDYLNTTTNNLIAPISDVLNEFGITGTSLQLTGASPLSSLITQTQNASQAHPATQAVAIIMQKGAANGKNTTITLQLNPEDLGKIQVRLEFSRNQSVKAHMMIEKPETHMMMQRDAHFLERALEDSGINTDEAITFDLANENHDFGQNGGHDHHDNPGITAPEDTEDNEETLETTMSWYVDPNTGLTRYDFLV